MRTPHVHAAVIKAWADGAQVQFFNKVIGEWQDLQRPNFHADREYRVKRVTVRYRVALTSTGLRFPENQLAANQVENFAGFHRWLTEWIEVEL